jgi:hypothetical protein
MRASPRTALAFLAIGLLVGLVVARMKGPVPPKRAIRSGLVARELQLASPGSPGSIRFASSMEGTPAMWMSHGPKGGSLQLGVHGNGFPFVLVSDDVIRNFGLARVDGKNASPILVFRSEDVVRMVFGLSMTEAGQPAFLVHYDGAGSKHDFLGRYCDDPGRACTR